MFHAGELEENDQKHSSPQPRCDVEVVYRPPKDSGGDVWCIPRLMCVSGWVEMGGIVGKWRNKGNEKGKMEDINGIKEKNEEGKQVEEKNDEIVENDVEMGDGKEDETVVRDEKIQEDATQPNDKSESNSTKLEKVVEPDKPIDQVYYLDLYPPPSIILKQIQYHLQQSKSVSKEVQKIFLSHPEKSFASKKKLKIEKLIFQPAIHLKQLKHKWLRPFTVNLSSLKNPIVCLDLHFRQLTSFKVVNLHRISRNVANQI